jgi:acetyl esterase/lipase
MKSSSLARHYRCVSARAEWLKRAQPLDYALAATDAAAAMPVIGQHLAPLGTLTAAGAWLSRNGSSSAGWLTGAARQMSGRHAQVARVPGLLQALSSAALEGLVPPDLLEESWPQPDHLPPFLRATAQRKRYLDRRAVRYGEAPHQVLDVWRRRDLPEGGRAPVLIFVPGGAWLHGGRQLQGYALMSHLAERGWVCLSVEYGVAPRHRWPRHVRDVRSAVTWARAHANDFGGDPSFVAIAGCSAGAHLAALIGLAADDPHFGAQPGFESDASVDAVVGLYGRYDWMDRSTRDRDEFMRFIEQIVVRKRMDQRPEIFEGASPIARTHADAPPFLVVHGQDDHVIPVEEARAFATRLRAPSRAPDGYHEKTPARHGFDLTDPWSAQAAIRATGAFLEAVRQARQGDSDLQVI